MTLVPPPQQFWHNGKPPVTFYEGPHYMYSNFSAFAVEIYGRVWPTAEHAYQSMKFTDAAIKDKVFAARSPYDAKQIAKAHQHLVRENWNSLKLSVMEEVLRAKLRQHPYIQEKLRATHARIMVEDSPTDSFWGRGHDWNGDNRLGKLWMELRDELACDAFE